MTSVASVSVLEDSSSSPPFEGPEKLLELWFAPSWESLRDTDGLRRVKRAVWEEVLDLVRCKVLSVIEGDEVDAYLLSESSMFVWPHKLILKTCGTTTLLLGLDRLMAIAREHCGLQDVWRCFYSRKAFMFPERQIGPHRHWDEEVKFLDLVFGVGNGSAYVVGKMNGDHWLLYMTSPREDHPATDHSPSTADHLIEDVLGSCSVASSSPPYPPSSLSTTRHHLAPPPPRPSSTKPFSPADQTLEILMTDLDSEACKAFFYPPEQQEGEGQEYDEMNNEPHQQGHLAGSQLSEKLGINTLLEGSTVDSFLFYPCGYSANIIKDDRYATIHVTPESKWSYASFECNIDFRTTTTKAAVATTASTTSDNNDKNRQTSQSVHDLIARVLNIFLPQRLSITLFESVEESLAAQADENASGDGDTTTPETRAMLDPRIAGGYRRTDRILYEFAGYHLLFSTFEKR